MTPTHLLQFSAWKAWNTAAVFQTATLYLKKTPKNWQVQKIFILLRLNTLKSFTSSASTLKSQHLRPPGIVVHRFTKGLDQLREHPDSSGGTWYFLPFSDQDFPIAHTKKHTGILSRPQRGHHAENATRQDFSGWHRENTGGRGFFRQVHPWPAWMWRSSTMPHARVLERDQGCSESRVRNYHPSWLGWPNTGTWSTPERRPASSLKQTSAEKKNRFSERLFFDFI